MMIEDDADQYLSREDFPGNQRKCFFSTFDYILWIAAVDSRDILDKPLNHHPSLSDLLQITIPKSKRSPRNNVTSPVFVSAPNFNQRAGPKRVRFDSDAEKKMPKRERSVGLNITFKALVDHSTASNMVNKNNQRVGSKRGRCDIDAEKDRPKHKKKKKIMITYVPPNPTPNLPANFKERIQGLNGSDLVLVIQKPLFATDVSKNHYRLSMPLNQIKNQFLSWNEKDALMNQNGVGVPEMEVFLIEPSCQKETKMNLKIWAMHKGPKCKAKVSYMYSLGKHWNEVVSGNGLEEGMTVQVWAFRVEGNLGFALVRVEAPAVPQEGNGA
ncbi:B3 domain-containing protein [Actinidia chinensis var. chinensis]|uniref:B3 domain-containing protein n=1 Tax=Actinidia chinensis var. chinensis TaxID=1590841 RepID=A0A2R6QZD5_ACTCC|nr:B3 domain-containing protein [Actinidia chinensis var. chinensis]